MTARTDAPRLDSWSCQSPARVLVGIVSGHPHVPDGPMMTSTMVMLDPVGRRAWTLNREYSLGDPDPDWVRWLRGIGRTPDDFAFDSEGGFP